MPASTYPSRVHLKLSQKKEILRMIKQRIPSEQILEVYGISLRTLRRIKCRSFDIMRATEEDEKDQNKPQDMYPGLRDELFRRCKDMNPITREDLAQMTNQICKEYSYEFAMTPSFYTKFIKDYHINVPEGGRTMEPFTATDSYFIDSFRIKFHEGEVDRSKEKLLKHKSFGMTCLYGICIPEEYRKMMVIGRCNEVSAFNLQESFPNLGFDNEFSYKKNFLAIFRIVNENPRFKKLYVKDSRENVKLLVSLGYVRDDLKIYIYSEKKVSIFVTNRFYNSRRNKLLTIIKDKDMCLEYSPLLEYDNISIAWYRIDEIFRTDTLHNLLERPLSKDIEGAEDIEIEELGDNTDYYGIQWA